MAIKPKKVRLGTRERKKYRIRKRIEGTDQRPRLSVYRSGKHIYAQVISDESHQTLFSASTLDKSVGEQISQTSAEGLHNEAQSAKSMRAARTVGLLLAERCQQKKISSIVFDRNGFIYHGRIKALADGAREGGLQF